MKKVVGLVLATLMLLTSFALPASIGGIKEAEAENESVYSQAKNADSNGVLAKMELVNAEIRRDFPTNLFTVDGKVCSSHTSYSGSCDNCEIHNIYKAKKGTDYPSTTNSWTCCAFARYYFYCVFGKFAEYYSPVKTGVKADQQSSYSSVMPGDYLKLSYTSNGKSHTHYVIFVSADSTGITVNNANRSAVRKIDLNEKLSYSSKYLNGTISYIHAGNYEDILSSGTTSDEIWIDSSFYQQETSAGCVLACCAMTFENAKGSTITYTKDGSTYTGFQAIYQANGKIDSAQWNTLYSVFGIREDTFIHTSEYGTRSADTVKGLFLSKLRSIPNGILAFFRTSKDNSAGHCIVIIGYRNGVFYVNDPARNVSGKEIPITQSYVARNLLNTDSQDTILEHIGFAETHIDPNRPTVPHTHDKGTYMFYEAAHPHRNAYKCSICGEVWADDDSSNYLTSCDQCLPGKPAFIGLSGPYLANTPIVFQWNPTTHTTHYNYWLYKENSSGEYELQEYQFYVESGFQKTLGVGNYKVILQSTDSNHWFSDGSTWVYMESDPAYFRVMQNEEDIDQDIWINSAFYQQPTGSNLACCAMTFENAKGSTITYTKDGITYAGFDAVYQANGAQNSARWSTLYNAFGIKEDTFIWKREYGTRSAEAVKDLFLSKLKSNPNGILACFRESEQEASAAHSVVIIGYLDGVFYVNDPATSINGKEIPINQSYIATNLLGTSSQDTILEHIVFAETHVDPNRPIDPSGSQYQVDYDANGGTGAPASQHKTHGRVLTLSSVVPSRANTVSNCTITLDANGGSVSPSSLSATCTTSYSFSSWNTAINGGGTAYAPGASYTADSAVCLYAQWDSQKTYASVVLPTPTRNGYDFIGWYSSATGGTKIGDGGTSFTTDGNRTLYAHWTEIPPNRCGDNLTWSFDEITGKLTITGSGAMYDFGWDFDSDELVLSTPWYSVHDQITAVSLPQGLTRIGCQAFRSCTKLTSITIPNSVTIIDEGAFYECTGLKSVIIPNSVTKIGEFAFGQCKGLITLTLGSGVTSIGEYAFAGTSNITAITVDSNNTWCSSVDGVLFTRNGEMLFYYPEVKKQNSYTIPDGVTGIAWGAFSGNKKLTSIIIPDSVVWIGEAAFADCTGLTTIVLPDSVTSIGTYAFSRCYGLTSIEVEQGNKKYLSVDGVLFTIDKKELVQYPAGKKQTNYSIPDGVTSFDWGAFEDCPWIMSVTIPDSVTEISRETFYGCEGLKSIIIPNSVTSIGWNAFGRCIGLQSITIPISVTHIDWGAFNYCNELKDVYYLGSAAQKELIDIDEGNEALENATWHFVTSPPTITTQPTDVTVAKGKQAIFTVVAANAENYIWQYQKPGESTWNDVINNGASATYTLTAATRHNGYKYRCQVDNALGTVYSNIVTLTVLSGKPTITTQPTSVTVAAGKKATFQVVATGADSYKWQYQKPGSSTWTNVSKNGDAATYTLTTAAKHNGYAYRCAVKNAAGTVYTNTVTLTVKVKPTITAQPKAVTVYVGKVATFTVAANDAESYKWQYQKPGSTTWTNVSKNGTAATYTLTTAAKHDGYTYRCAVKNGAGTVYTDAVKLTVSEKPVITTQPKAASVAAGKKATFKVAADGATSYRWQYQKPGSSTWTNVSKNGTSASYSLTTAAKHNGYTYRCAVKNDKGTVYTKTVTLTVE